VKARSIGNKAAWAGIALLAKVSHLPLLYGQFSGDDEAAQWWTCRTRTMMIA